MPWILHCIVIAKIKCNEANSLWKETNSQDELFIQHWMSGLLIHSVFVYLSLLLRNNSGCISTNLSDKRTFTLHANRCIYDWQGRTTFSVCVLQSNSFDRYNQMLLSVSHIPSLTVRPWHCGHTSHTSHKSRKS